MTDNSDNLLNELKEMVYRLDKKLDLNTQKTEMTLDQVTKINEDQNQTIKSFSDRLKNVEVGVDQAKKPIEWVKMTMQVLGGLSLILGLIYTILKFKG